MLKLYATHAGQATLEPRGKKTWLLLGIRILGQSQGRGHGTAIMRRILADADHHGFTLRLNIAGHTYPGEMTATQLTKWYHRLGFRPRGASMVRRPRKGKK